MSRMPSDTGMEFASPPCSLHEVGPSHGGYASAEELVAYLGALAETLQNMACDMAETCRLAPPPPQRVVAVLVPAVGRSVKATGIVRRQLKRLGAELGCRASRTVQEPAAVLMTERLSRAARQCRQAAYGLQAMCPRVRCDRLQADLTAVKNDLIEIAAALVEATEANAAAK